MNAQASGSSTEMNTDSTTDSGAHSQTMSTPRSKRLKKIPSPTLKFEQNVTDYMAYVTKRYRYVFLNAISSY